MTTDRQQTFSMVTARLRSHAEKNDSFVRQSSFKAVTVVEEVTDS
jgi:hypothetical protein